MMAPTGHTIRPKQLAQPAFDEFSREVERRAELKREI
jgi:hypothetical protein